MVEAPLNYQNSPKVLVVEDDPVSAQILEDLIMRVEPNSQVRWVTTEEQAARILLNQTQEGKIGLVVADYYLPGKTGAELIQRFQEQVPYFILTSSSQRTQQKTNHITSKANKCFFVEKPFKDQLLQDRLRMIFHSLNKGGADG